MNRRHGEWILLSIIFLFSLSSWAHLSCSYIFPTSQDSLVTQINALLTYEEAEILISDLKKKNAEIFSDPNLSEAEQLAHSLFAYLELRFSQLPAESAGQVRNIFHFKASLKRYKNEDPHYGIQGYKRFTCELEIGYPELVEQSPSLNAVQSHELEHAVQGAVFKDNKTYLFATRFKHLRALEKGALTAEGVYLLSLPRPLLQKWHDHIKQNPLPRRQDQKFYIQQLKGALSSRSPQEFVQTQRRAGRNSYLGLIRARSRHMLKYLVGR